MESHHQQQQSSSPLKHLDTSSLSFLYDGAPKDPSTTSYRHPSVARMPPLDEGEMLSLQLNAKQK